jgi:hypothetical protein
MFQFLYRKRFKLEHYPITGKYYVKFKGGYLRKDYNTGIVRNSEWGFRNDLYEGTFSLTEKDAHDLIDLFLEQNYKQKVTTQVLKIINS